MSIARLADYGKYILPLALSLCASGLSAQDAVTPAESHAALIAGFQNPPQEARPRVWWHWMDGNITKDGIRKDIEWMQRAGIGGFHCFEAGTGIKPVVDRRLTYMSPEWKDAFRYAVALADSLGMETTIPSCPGWSNTGGPWVTPEQAMKKLVWSETLVKGGKAVDVTLPEPQKNQWYKDICVMAVRRPKADKTMEELGATYTTSGEDESPAWVQYAFPKPQTIKALTISDGYYRTIWAALPAPVSKWLEVSDDGLTFRRVCGIPHGSIRRQTIDIEPTTARYFRVVFDEKPRITPELTLYTIPKINQAEEKAGYASPVDMLDYVTTASDNETVPPSDVIDLTAHFNYQLSIVNCQLPKGNWRILRFGYTLTGKQNHPAPKEATGLEVTKMDKEAFSNFLDYYLDRYQEVTDRLQYLLIDSYEAGWETWAPNLPEAFERRRGYSLRPWMPVLTGTIVGSAEESEAFLTDWRTTIGELVSECMYENATRIAHERGLKTYFEAHENGRLYLADGMSVKRHADIPMAAIWIIIPGEKSHHSLPPMAESDIRESASVAHLYGKPLVAVESMTADGNNGSAYSYYPGNLKPTADLELACGANRIVIHESAHQPVDDKRPGLGLMQYGQWFNRHETWAEQARPWTDYLARSSYLLQQGQNVADILYYYGEDDVITNLFAHQHPAIPAGYNFDYLNKDALLDLISYDGQHFVTPSGSQYRVLVVSDKCRRMSAPVQQKIDALRQQGAPIIDERTTSCAEVIRTSIAPDFQTADMDSLRYVHRTTGDSDIYWVSNQREAARSLDAVFRVSGRKPSLWHPDTGEVEDVSYTVKDSCTIVHLDLVANDAVFVVFSGPLTADRVQLPAKRETLLCQIDTPWAVQFPEKQATFPSLVSYTASDDKDIKYFSGTATYRNTFTLPATSDGQTVLDLGEVGCMAEVIVNGQNVGTLWKAPYRADITKAAKPGTNELEVRVTNQWVNRIIGDQQPDCTEPHTYTPQQFYNADSPLLPAGLMGPVAVYRVSREPSLVPAQPSQAPDYLCTWNLQCYVSNQDGPTKNRAEMNERNLFGDGPLERWATFYPAIHEDLFFVMDDSWDIPADQNDSKDNPYLGTTRLDITSRVHVEGSSLTVPGSVIAEVGLSAASEGDVSDPGLVLTIQRKD